MHVLLEHTCMACRCYNFKNRQERDQHQVACHPTLTFKCKNCSVIFSRQSSLARHAGVCPCRPTSGAAQGASQPPASAAGPPGTLGDLIRWVAEHVGEDATQPLLPRDRMPDLRVAPTDTQLAMYDLLRWAKSVAVREGVVRLRPGALDGTIRSNWTKSDLQSFGVEVVQIAHGALGLSGRKSSYDKMLEILKQV